MGDNVQRVILPDNDELDWIKMRQDFDNTRPEPTKDKMLRKIKENPFVPIGCLGTACVLFYGLYNFRTGNRRMAQLMMRTRIAAQGLTVFALITGVVLTYKPKE